MKKMTLFRYGKSFTFDKLSLKGLDLDLVTTFKIHACL